jgi:hypothetical protein
MAELEAEIDRLYGVPLDEFVVARDGLAKQLNRDGQREAGARVKALRKPTVGAWALNQALRRRRAEKEALLATAERLREAQQSLLSGGDPADLREAIREERALTSTLAESAEAIASETGKSGPALRDRVRATLHAAALDEEARAELEAGRFTREREAVGLGAFDVGGTATAAPARAPARKPAGGAKRARANAKPARAPAAKPSKPAKPPAPDPRLLEAERDLAEARSAHETAVAEHEAAAAALGSARETLREAEVAEREARRVAREHEREVAKRERKLDRLRPKR